MKSPDPQYVEAVSHALRHRRAVYPPAFSDEKIPLETITSLLELANWAPTHRMTEPWRYVVYSGDAVERLADAMVLAYKAHVGEDGYKEKTEKKIRAKCAKAQYILLIAMQRDPQERVPEWEEIAATAMSVQNFWIALTARGLGGYWSSPGFSERMNEYAELPSDARCLGFFYVGVPAATMPDSSRTPISERVRFYS